MTGTNLENYLLTFSSPDKRKNTSRVMQAFLKVQGRIPDNFKLVVVGNRPKNDDAFKAIASSDAAERIVITGPVDEIGNLFCCAEALVFASLYEGFGIPILEAFARNVPVITSDCSSMPEVAGQSALYVDPYSVESIGEAIIKVCTNFDIKEKLIKSAQLQLKKFSWQKSAEKTLEVYKKFL